MATAKSTAVVEDPKRDYDQAMTADPWMPKEGDKVEGKIVGIYKGETDYGIYPILGIRTTFNPDTGAASFSTVHAFHSLLQSALRDAKVQRGDNVSIEYVGEKLDRKARAKVEAGGQIDKDDTSYHLYHVFVNGDMVGGREEWSWDEQ